MIRGPLALLACTALAVGALVAGCGGDDSGSSTSVDASTTATASVGDASGAAAATDEVRIADFAYRPESLNVDAGATVTWTNDDDAEHTATADDGSFDTGTLAKGDSATETFDEPGTYAYVCSFHPFMKATVEVQ